MNMYWHELRSGRKSALVWTFAMIGLAAMYLAMFPSITHDAEGFKEVMESYPPNVRAMLGINLDLITSLIGFYSMVFSIIALCGAIQAMNLGLSVLSKESRERTADFLLVKPVSRKAIVTAKLLAAFTILLLTNVFFYGMSALLANLVDTTGFSNKLFLMINLTLFFVQLIFLALGVAISVFFSKLKNVLPISLGIIFGLYMIGALLATGEGDAVRYISPFRYFDPAYIIKHSSYEIPYLIVAAVLILVSVAVSYVVYSKKDIHAVS